MFIKLETVLTVIVLFIYKIRRKRIKSYQASSSSDLAITSSTCL